MHVLLNINCKISDRL